MSRKKSPLSDAARKYTDKYDPSSETYKRAVRGKRIQAVKAWILKNWLGLATLIVSTAALVITILK